MEGESRTATGTKSFRQGEDSETGHGIRAPEHHHDPYSTAQPLPVVLRRVHSLDDLVQDVDTPEIPNDIGRSSGDVEPGTDTGGQNDTR